VRSRVRCADAEPGSSGHGVHPVMKPRQWRPRLALVNPTGLGFTAEGSEPACRLAREIVLFIVLVIGSNTGQQDDNADI
jgi:hypothetical protein